MIEGCNDLGSTEGRGESTPKHTEQKRVAKIATLYLKSFYKRRLGGCTRWHGSKFYIVPDICNIALKIYLLIIDQIRTKSKIKLIELS